MNAPDPRRMLDLLIKASRTFALNIPLLPRPLMEAVTVGYLLLRNADTLEDAYRWPRERRTDELERYIHVLTHPADGQGAQEFADRFGPDVAPENAGHLEVLRETPTVLAALNALPSGYAPVIIEHVERVARRMIEWVNQHDAINRLSLRRLQELDDYCYSVAGIVGEMITSLIAVYYPALNRSQLLYLRTLETAYGAGLQLTNIIKDVLRDHEEGRHYIPQEYLPVGPDDGLECILPIFNYAYRNLSHGIEYVLALPPSETGLRKACLVPLLLAAATLTRLQTHTEELFSGADVKISRETVMELLQAVERVVSDNLQIRQTWAQLTQPLAVLNEGFIV